MSKISKIIVLVTNPKNLNGKDKLTFTDFPILIGRDSSCNLVLPDQRKLVSRNHAKISLEEEQLFITDLGSRNATFINQNKIIPNKEHKLNQQDIIKIGEYHLQVNDIYKEEIHADDATLIFCSPFAEEVENLKESLLMLSNKYSATKDELKDEYLKMDLLNILSPENFDSIKPIIETYFYDKGTSDIDQGIQEDKSEDKFIYKERNYQSPSSQNQSQDNLYIDDHFQKLKVSIAVDSLIELLIKLVQGFWHFRQEFFGVTIYQSLPITTVEKLKEYLFDPTVSDEEFEKRLALLKEEFNKVLSHQVGLLDGYKESINNGITKVLDEFDQELLTKKINTENLELGSIKIPIKYIPLFAKIKSIEISNSTLKKYRADINHIERKHFRQAFIKGYQKRLHFE